VRLLNSNLKWCAFCGVIGPITFTIVVIALGLLQPAYNHVTQYVSELGAMGAPNAIIMNVAGFFLLGMLIVAFAFGLHFGVNEGKGSRTGPVFLAVSGAGFVAVGLFPCDPGCMNVSFSGLMHVVSARITWIGLILALLFIAQRFKSDPEWKGYRLYTLATALIVLIVAVMLDFIGIEGWMGALQRVFLGVRLLWLEIVAIKLLRLSIRSSVAKL